MAYAESDCGRTVVRVRGSQPLALVVDPVRDAAEWQRFCRRVVAGPDPQDCHLWVGAIGSDGYGRISIRRGGRQRVVRTSRYALAGTLAGSVLSGEVNALHECDNPLCVRVVSGRDVRAGIRPHVVAGSQQENMQRMGMRGRGGGRPAIITRGAGVVARVARSRQLREAVRAGWDAGAVRAALLGDQEPTLW